MTIPTTNDEMNVSINDAREALLQAWYVKDPARKLELVKQVLVDLEMFDDYWTDVFETEE